jgi:hypothetical protein
MSKNKGKSKLSKNVLFNASKHVFHCEKSLATLFYGQPSYIYIYIYIYITKWICYESELVWNMWIAMFLFEDKAWLLYILLFNSVKYISYLTASVVYWSEFLAADPVVWVRFPALPDFLRSSGSEMGSTEPEFRWGATWKTKKWLQSRKPRLWP